MCVILSSEHTGALESQVAVGGIKNTKAVSSHKIKIWMLSVLRVVNQQEQQTFSWWGSAWNVTDPTCV